MRNFVTKKFSVEGPS